MSGIDAHPLVPGTARGPVIALAVPLSFWGGFDSASGAIIDRSHPDCGRVLTGAVLVMPSGRGSGSASSVLAEALRRGTAPAGIVLAEADPVITVGAIVARMLYSSSCPVVVCAEANFGRVARFAAARIEAGDTAASISESDG